MISTLVAAMVAMGGPGCNEMMHPGSSAPPGPPAGRHQSCLSNNGRCQEGLSCVQYSDSAGTHADCEIPCGAGCPEGMTCGTIHSPIYGDGATNVCL